MSPRGPRRPTSRRALLAGGAGIAAVAAVGAGVATRGGGAAAPKRFDGFYLGMNLSGLEDPIPEGASQRMFDRYASYGIRHIRLAGRWEWFQPKVGGPLDKDYLKLYLTSVRRAAERDIKVVMEPCHNYGKRRIGKRIEDFGSGRLTPEMFADFWQRFVAATGDVEGVDAWEPMGEPAGMTGTPQEQSKAWARAANAAVEAIRATGDERVIKIDVSQPGSHTAWTTDNVALHTVEDPLDRLVFSNHVYMDRNNSGKFRHWSEEIRATDTHAGGVPLTYDVGVKRLEPFVAWLRKHDLRGEVGEVGVGWADSAQGASSAGWQIALDTTLRYCQEQGLPAFAWGAGPHLIRPYELSLEPGDGMDAPQWIVLQRYLPLTADPDRLDGEPSPTDQPSDQASDRASEQASTPSRPESDGPGDGPTSEGPASNGPASGGTPAPPASGGTAAAGEDGR